MHQLGYKKNKKLARRKVGLFGVMFYDDDRARRAAQLRHREELRVALEQQIASKGGRSRQRDYVEPKIGAPPQLSNPPTEPAPMHEAAPFEPHGPTYSNISPARSPHRDRGSSPEQVKRSLELRAALEEQIEMKKRKQHELIVNERRASRERLGLGGVPTSHPLRASAPMELSPVAERRLVQQALPVAFTVADARVTPPPTWHSHEFLDLSKKIADEKARKEHDRQKATELKRELELQIQAKKQSKREQLEQQRHVERVHDEEIRRQHEAITEQQRQQQAENARRQLQLQDENLHIAQSRLGQHSSKGATDQPVPPSRLPPAVGVSQDHVVVSPVPWQRSESPVVTFSPALGQPAALPPVSASPLLPHDPELNSILSRIHRELLQQRQDLLSPSIFSAIPLSNPSRLAAAGLNVAQPGGGVSSLNAELPSDRQLVRSKALSPSPLLGVKLSAPGAHVFSMTDWMHPLNATSDGGGATMAPNLSIGDGFSISDTLRRNQHRLQKLRFARHNDDILRIFLQQDTSSSIAAAAAEAAADGAREMERLAGSPGIKGTAVDTPLPPPSFMHRA